MWVNRYGFCSEKADGDKVYGEKKCRRALGLAGNKVSYCEERRREQRAFGEIPLGCRAYYLVVAPLPAARGGL